MATDTGVVTSVEVATIGSTLDVDAAATDTTLLVEDNQPFLEGTPILVTTVDGATATATVGPLPPADNFTTLNLTAPLGIAAEAGSTFVAPQPEQIAVTAFVATDAAGEPLPCLVPHTLQDAMAPGLRDPGLGETVVYGRDETTGELKVLDVVGRVTVRDLSAADPETVPPPATDGEAPAPVTDLVAAGGIRSIFLSWTPVPNHDLVTYVVHGSTDPAFEPTPDTYLTQTGGSRATVYEAWDPVTGKKVKISPGTTFHFRVVATDDDVSDDTPASASAVVAGVAAAITGPDIAVDAVAAEHIRGNSVSADKLSASMAMLSDTYWGDRMSIIPNGDMNGLRIRLNDGVIALPADGTPARVDAGINAKGITSERNLVVQGNGNRLQSRLLLAGGITSPAEPPTVTTEWPYISSAPLAQSTFVGLTYDPDAWDTGVPGYWTTRKDLTSERSYVAVIRASDGATRDAFLFSIDPTVYLRGVVRVGSELVVLRTAETGDGRFMIYRFSTSGTQLQNRVVGTSETSGGDLTDVSEVCYDGTHVIWAAFRHTDDKIVFTRANPATLATVDTSTTGTTSDPDIAQGMHMGSADFGAARIVLGRSTGFSCYTPTWGGVANRVVASDFKFAQSARPAGLAWDGVRFVSKHEDRLHAYSRIISTAAVVAQFAYLDSDPTGGQHETTRGAERTFTPTARAWHRLTGQVPDDKGGIDDPDSIRFYLDNSRQPDLPVGVITALYDVFTTGGPAGQTSNGFASIPNGMGTIRSEKTDAYGSVVNIPGGGEGRVGPLYWPDQADVALFLGARGIRLGDGAAGRDLRNLNFGSVTITIPNGSRSATATVAHALPGTPAAVLPASVGSALDYSGKVQGYDATNITLRAERTGTSGAAAVIVFWLALI